MKEQSNQSTRREKQTICRRQFLQTAMIAPTLVTLKLNSTTLEADDKQESIYLSDMSLCQPKTALSPKAKRHHWRLLNYETEKFKGVMLVAGKNTAAPEVRYPVNHKGWYAISFGIRSYGGGEDETKLLVKLQGDSTFSMVSHQAEPSSRNQVDDYFWKIAELTGEDLVFRQFCLQLDPDDPGSVGNPCNGVWLAYIKLVQLTARQVESVKQERQDTTHKRLFAHHDAWSYTYTYRPTTEAEVRRELEPFWNTDFARVYWEGGMGDRMYYPTKIGIYATDDWIDDPYRLGDRLAAEAWQSFKKKGIDPFRTALEYVHKMGVEFHGTYRPAGFHFPVPEDQWNEGGLYDRHPEWRGRDRAGRPTPRLSYAYPEVRRAVISFLKEMATYPIDGICIAYNRRPPLLEYEPPMVDGFKAKHGKDPRQLDENDPQWLGYRATFLTQFMREVKSAMQEVAREHNRAKVPQVSAIVMSSEKENLYFAMDLKAWIAEKLVDTIIPYTSVERLTSSADSWTNPKDAEFFIQITKGTPCKLALNMMPRQLTPEEYRRRAHALYEAGVDHLFFWDSDQRNDFNPSWSTLRRLGHKEELAAWVRAGSPRVERPGSTLKKLGDWDLGYATPG